MSKKSSAPSLAGHLSKRAGVSASEMRSPRMSEATSGVCPPRMSLRSMRATTNRRNTSPDMSKKSSAPIACRFTSAHSVAPFRVDGSKEFHLKSHKTNAKGGIDKDRAKRSIEANRKRLSDFQEKLYAEDRWSLLLIFQGIGRGLAR